MTHRRAKYIRGVSVPVLILLVGAGCQYRWSYLTPDPVAVSPIGTEVSIRVQEGAGDRSITGELIEVRGDGLLVLASEISALTLLPYDRIVEMDFENALGVDSGIDRSSGSLGIPPSRQRDLAQFSRYPFGLDDGQLQSLLEAHGQSELVVIG